MHELSLAYDLVRQLEEVLRREGATRVVQIDMELGGMSGVEREPFEFAFPIASEGTEIEGARLVFVEVPVKVRCRDCGEASSPQYPFIVCDKCGSRNVDMLEGRDFKIKSMEVE